MFDLKPRIRLNEHEALRRIARRVEEEFECAEVPVANLPGEPDCRLSDRFPQLTGEARGRRNLDELLESALDAALAFAKVDDVPIVVTQNLHLDVPGMGNELLDVEGIIAERPGGFRAAAVERSLNLVPRRHSPCASATTAPNRLNHHLARTTQRVEERLGIGQGDGPVDTTGDWNAHSLRRLTSSGFVAE